MYYLSAICLSDGRVFSASSLTFYTGIENSFLLVIFIEILVKILSNSKQL